MYGLPPNSLRAGPGSGARQPRCRGRTKRQQIAAANGHPEWALALLRRAAARPRRRPRSEEYECKMSAKWRALGADKVKFINTELTNIGERGGRRCWTAV
jgi:hypothetical protein